MHSYCWRNISWQQATSRSFAAGDHCTDVGHVQQNIAVALAVSVLLWPLFPALDMLAIAAAAFAVAAVFHTLQIQAMAAMQDEMGPKSVTVLVTWDANDHGGNVHFEVRGCRCCCC
jgi:hypothetical protein